MSCIFLAINRSVIKSSYGKQKTLHSTTLHFRGENNPRVYNVTSINDIHIDITLINASSPRAFFLSMLRAFGMRTIKPIVVVRTCSPVQMHASILLIRDIIPAFVRSVTRNSVFQGLLWNSSGGRKTLVKQRWTRDARGEGFSPREEGISSSRWRNGKHPTRPIHPLCSSVFVGVTSA